MYVEHEYTIGTARDATKTWTGQTLPEEQLGMVGCKYHQLHMGANQTLMFMFVIKVLTVNIGLLKISVYKFFLWQ